MFPSWRMQLGEARRALRSGELDRACAIVQRDDLKEFRQARELSAELADLFAERARGRMREGHSSAGWKDIQLARQIAGSDAPVDELERDYRSQLVDRACRYLAEGRTKAAAEELTKLVRHNLADADIRNLVEWTTRLSEAEQMLAAGNAAEAGRVLEQLAANLPSLFDRMANHGAAARVATLKQQCDEHVRLSSELLTATERSDWHHVLATADRLLAVAARDRVARAARRQAWHAVGLDATQLYQAGGRKAGPKQVASLALRDTSAVRRPTASTHRHHDTMSDHIPPNRFMMWVDAVGGFLVCLDDEVVLGQPAHGAAIAVPLCADLSRRHAVIRREGGAYTIDPLGEVSVDGRPLTGPMVLGTRHEIQLGSAVRLEFTKPHALSATARLTPLSGHRTEPRADAVLLMADSCVLGPKSHSHVACRRWPGDVILFRQQGRLHCRSTLAMTVDGATAEGATPVASGARLEGEEFAISLEEA
jgi:hypothetical protein